MNSVRIAACALAGALCSTASGQWYWPPTEGVGVFPECAAPGEGLVARVAGDWPDSCPPNVIDVKVSGFEVDVDLATEPPPGFCLTVITAYQLESSFGPLPEGEYTVYTTYYIDGIEQLPRTRVASFIVDPACAGCYPDCDGSGDLDFFDFLCFQDAFAAGEPYADCDGSGALDFFDFLCFQNEFAAGCP
jgi:hypothetical protein